MYGKLFASMYDGTLYGQWQAIVTLQQLVVLANSEGVVDMTPPAIAARTSIPLEIIEAGLVQLSEADKYSRSDAEQGRRIVLIDPDRPWGWRIVNHAKYRNMSSQRDRAEYMREYMRGKRKQEKLTEVNSKQSLALLGHTDTDTDICKSGKKRFQPPTIEEVTAYITERGSSVDPNRFVDFYASKDWYVGKNKMKDWKAALRNWDSNSRDSKADPYATANRV
jgi:hypothetical protein